MKSSELAHTKTIQARRLLSGAHMVSGVTGKHTSTCNSTQHAAGVVGKHTEHGNAEHTKHHLEVGEAVQQK